MEREAHAALKIAAAAISALRKFHSAAQLGNLKDLRKNIDFADQTVMQLKEQIEKARASWTLNDEEYLAGHAAALEFLNAAEEAGLKMFELDERLYCHPFLIRTLPEEGAVLIDKSLEKRIRPSFLIKYLKQLQEKPSKFKPETFLECLFECYEVLSAARGKGTTRNGTVVKLKEIYRLLTLLPGQNKNYSIQEFARDIYLLDKSLVNRTKKGFKVQFPADTGTKTKNPLSVITEDGIEKIYYGISFSYQQETAT